MATSFGGICDLLVLLDPHRNNDLENVCPVGLRNLRLALRIGIVIGVHSYFSPFRKRLIVDRLQDARVYIVFLVPVAQRARPEQSPRQQRAGMGAGPRL